MNNLAFRQFAINTLLMIPMGLIFAIYVFLGVQFAHYFGSIYANLNPFYLLAAPYRLLMESTGMKSVALVGTLYFGWLLVTDGLFAKRVLNVAFYPVKLLFRIVFGTLKWAFRKLFGKNQPPSKFMTAFRALRRSVSHYYEKGEIMNSLRAFFEFAPYVAFPPFLELYPASGPWRAQKETFFEDRNLYSDVWRIVKKNVAESAYPSEFRREGSGISFLLHVQGMTGEQAKAKMEAVVGEICRALPGYDPKAERFANEILVERDAISVNIERQPVFLDRMDADLDGMLIDIPEGYVRLGFGPGETPEPVLIPRSRLLHCASVAQSGGGKDFQTLNVVSSLLADKLRGKKISIHLFDSKGMDWSVFDSRQKHSIFRHTRKENESEFADRLEELVADMRVKSEKIGKYGSVERYDAEHPEDPIGHTYVFLNEAISLFSNESASETKRTAAALIAILCEGRAAGYRGFLLSQSLRGDSLKGSFGRILVNIDSVFAGRVSSKTEAAIVGRQLDPADRSRLVALPKHSFLHIQEGKIQSTFKPLYIDQIMTERYLDKHFPKTASVPTETPRQSLERELRGFAADPKVYKFLEDAAVEGEYRWRFAQNAGVSEPAFRKLGGVLKKLGYIELRQGAAAKFVKPFLSTLIDLKKPTSPDGQ